MRAWIPILLAAGWITEAAAAPPSSAMFAVCPDEPGTKVRMRGAGSDSPEGYWWSATGFNALTTPGRTYWFKSSKPTYAELHNPTILELLPHPAQADFPPEWNWTLGLRPPLGTHANGFTTAVDSLDVVGSHNWVRSLHAWGSGVISTPSKLFAFYHIEDGSCGYPNDSNPTTCTSRLDCPDPEATGQQLCYWDKHTGLPDPGAGLGYCWLKTAGNWGMMSSTDDGLTWKDNGLPLPRALLPHYCELGKGVPLSGGIRGPKPVLDPDGHVYVFFGNLNGDPDNPTAILNQGVLVIRASVSDLTTKPDPVNWFHFYDGSAHQWMPETTQETSLAKFRNNAVPLNNMRAQGSWITSGPWGGGGACWGGLVNCKGNYFWDSPHWNTALGTYVMFMHSFRRADQFYSNNPPLFYYAGLGLDIDPLNWKPFEHWRDVNGNVQTPASWDGVSQVNYRSTCTIGVNYASGDANDDYYFGLVAKNASQANPGCSGNGYGGGPGETDKCGGQWMDLFNLTCFGLPGWIAPESPNGGILLNHTSRVSVRFGYQTDALTCTGPDYLAPETPGPGPTPAVGGGRVRPYRR